MKYSTEVLVSEEAYNNYEYSDDWLYQLLARDIINKMSAEDLSKIFKIDILRPGSSKCEEILGNPHSDPKEVIEILKLQRGKNVKLTAEIEI